mmetsp:Transcript_13603/g.37592  ORF Transcript_13603/g.37592 Transcript_13603/m.37592 type:complete len:114 (-) Transcript_13603:594-935(-)
MIIPHQPRTIPAVPRSPQVGNIAADTKDAFQEQFPVGRVFDDVKVATVAAHKLSHAFGFTVARSGYKIMCSHGVPPKKKHKKDLPLGEMVRITGGNETQMFCICGGAPQCAFA